MKKIVLILGATLFLVGCGEKTLVEEKTTPNETTPTKTTPVVTPTKPPTAEEIKAKQEQQSETVLLLVRENIRLMKEYRALSAALGEINDQGNAEINLKRIKKRLPKIEAQAERTLRVAKRANPRLKALTSDDPQVREFIQKSQVIPGKIITFVTDVENHVRKLKNPPLQLDQQKALFKAGSAVRTKSSNISSDFVAIGSQQKRWGRANLDAWEPVFKQYPMLTCGIIPRKVTPTPGSSSCALPSE